MTFTGVSPVLLSSDLKRSLAFYGEGLGFTGEPYGDDFAIVSRDGQSIFLALTDKPIVPEVRERGTEIDYGLYDAPHGMREFGVTDPDGHDVAFGQPIGA